MERSLLPNASLSGTWQLGDLSVNRLGFGAMQITGPGVWGPPKDKEEAKALLRRVIELGINFIDTADSYGPEVSENLIREALHPYPEDLVIGTKGGLTRGGPEIWDENCQPQYLLQCVEKSLKRLGLDCIPLYQLHTVDPAVPIEDSLGALKQMQDQGKIRYIGLSNVSIADIEKAKKIVDIVSVQNHYNIRNRKSENVLKYCEANNLAFIPWFPIESGDLAAAGGEIAKLARKKGITTVQLALAWLLKHSSCMLPIPGTSSKEHLEEDVAAASIEFTKEELAQLDLLTS